ncbi:hypothetical protein ACHAQH_003310 [Verticillium albo-atrum]
MPASLSAPDVDSETLRSVAEIIFADLRTLEEIPDYHEQISRLRHQLESIIKACHYLREDAPERRGERPIISWINAKDRQSLHELRQSVNTIIGRCYYDTARPLQEQLGNLKPAYGRIRESEALYLSPKDVAWYDDLTATLQLQAQTLELLLGAIGYVYTRKKPNPAGEPDSPTIKTAGRLQTVVEDLKYRLDDNLGDYGKCSSRDVQSTRLALEAVDAMGQPWPSNSINQHFPLLSGTSKYTGRLRELQEIRNAFCSFPEATQRRFVIQGPPGLGKSELALKYASDERTSYWGVFFVDASSKENAIESFKRIAEIEGTALNQFSAAKNWLSTRDVVYEWLLILDNVDVDEDWVEDLFPSGPRGCLLLTTRNIAHLRHGTVGQLRLKEMQHEDANALLLRSAQIAQPWTTVAIDHARSVCEFLCYLPIALVHAGRAIVQELCDLAGYIDFVDKTIHRVRDYWVYIQKHANSHSPDLLRAAFAEDKGAKYIFGTYEVLYESLEGATTGRKNLGNLLKIERCHDALQILQAFSFMHFQNIRLDMLICAAVNPCREAEAQAVLDKEEKDTVQGLGIQIQRSKKDFFLNMIRNLMSWSELPPVLPDALKNSDDLDIEKLENVVLIRVRSALQELEVRGLITRSDSNDNQPNALHGARYHMHPMVHRWVRERPRPTAAEDGLFCQIAKTVLARAVRLVGTDGKDEQAMCRELRPHVDHVRKCELVIRQRIQANQKRSRAIWSSMKLFPHAAEHRFGKMQAIEHARFGKVYMETGEFAVAEALFREVHSLAASRAGHDHDVTNRVQLALYQSLSHQTRHNEAEDMIRKVYESRKRTLGPDHPQTLRATRDLGQSVLGQGRLTESLMLCERARDGFQRAYGGSHHETLMAISDIAKVHFFKLNLEESLRHHEMAFRRAETLSKDHALPEGDFLSLKEDFASALAKVKKKQSELEEAESLLREVIERRAELLGKSHPYTLYARAKLGRVLGVLKRFEEAEELFIDTLKTAQRTVGDEHLGVLAGKIWFGEVLLEKGDLARAEAYIRPATNRELYRIASGRDGEYQDRIMAVWILIKCLTRQGKLVEALELCRELEISIPLVGGLGLGSDHRLLRMVSEEAEILEDRIKKVEQDSEQQEEPFEGSAASLVPAE